MEDEELDLWEQAGRDQVRVLAAMIADGLDLDLVDGSDAAIQVASVILGDHPLNLADRAIVASVVYEGIREEIADAKAGRGFWTRVK